MFLGFDCSTQSFSVVAIDFEKREVVYEKSIPFQESVIRFPDPLVVHSSPSMWAEALDHLFEAMARDGVDLRQVKAIAGSAQQHGSVYLNKGFEKGLASHDLKGIYSRKTAPIWMDASTSAECEEIRSSLGGMLPTIEATGSNTFERFTGPQIRKFYKSEPEKYEETAHIALVSSFLASILLGKAAPIDFGDGSGMNLMDIRKKAWHPKAIEATAPGLLRKLPPLAAPWKVLGKISPYYAKKYGIDALILPWTGDNPSSLIGLGLIEEGRAAISLGTSFTYFADFKQFRIDPKGEGHLFVSPNGDYMSLNCFQNGAFAIDEIRRIYDLKWPGFLKILEETPPGNQGRLMLPYFQQEIIPKVLKPEVHRLHLDQHDIPGNCRALIEAQGMSMRLHAAWMDCKPREIYATGGIANNPQVLQIMADIHGCPVLKSPVSKSTALGAALRAAHGYFGNRPWAEIVAGFTDPVSRTLPNPQASQVYNALLEKYASFEKRHLV